MQKLIYTKGLPASGKSTWARSMVEKHDYMKRVNKDDLRSMIDNNIWSWENEKFILKIRDQIIERTLIDGHSIIVDDTNLAPKHVTRFHEIVNAINDVHKLNIKVQEQFFDISVEECIRRDLNRERSVGEKVIRDMYNKYLNPIKRNEQPVYNPDLPDAIICDLDGTLALYDDQGNSARHYDRDFINDKCNKIVLDVINRYCVDNKLIIFSGRNGKYFQETQQWLALNKIYPDKFVMREATDRRKDIVIKQEMYETHVKDKYNVKFCIDDRRQVIKLWQSLGLYVLDVGRGFEF
jgi:predicted kinase